VLISSRNSPFSSTPGIELEPSVSWMRPATPELSGLTTSIVASSETRPVTAPRNGIEPPTAPMIDQCWLPSPTARVIWMNPFSVTTPPMVICAAIVAAT